MINRRSLEVVELETTNLKVNTPTYYQRDSKKIRQINKRPAAQWPVVLFSAGRLAGQFLNKLLIITKVFVIFNFF